MEGDDPSLPPILLSRSSNRKFPAIQVLLLLPPVPLRSIRRQMALLEASESSLWPLRRVPRSIVDLLKVLGKLLLSLSALPVLVPWCSFLEALP